MHIVSKETAALGRLFKGTRLLAAHALASCIINVAIYVLSEPRDFLTTDAMRNRLLPWAIGVNISTVALIAFFSHFLGWKRRLGWVISSDVVTSVIPFALTWCLSIPGETVRVQVFGIVYTIFVFSKCFLLVWYAFVNATEARGISVHIWIVTVSFLVYAAITPWVAIGAWPDGDEPHYLLLTHSLLVDRDFIMENDYRLGHYKSFYPADLPPSDHHTLVNRRQEEVPVHDVGVSILMVPGYALGGRLGAMIELNLVGALAALGIFVLAVQIGGTVRGAIAAWALYAFTSPLVVFSSQLFPEIAGAAFSVWAMIGFTKIVKDDRWSLLVLVGCLLGLLPWFSIRYWTIVAPLFLLIAFYVLAHIRKDGWIVVSKRLLMLLMPLSLSLTLFALFDKRYYDTMVPNAAYVLLGSDPERLSSWVFNQKGILGLLLDRAYGLLITTPVYIIALAGAVASWRRRSTKERWVNITIVVVSALCTFLPGTNFWWSGGWSPPSRYLVSTVVLWAPLAALVVLNSKTKILVLVLSAWSFFVAAAYTAFPLTRYGLLVTTGALSLFINKYTGVNYEVVFPSLIRAEAVDYALVAFWIAVAVLCIWTLNKNQRRRKLDSLG